MRIVNIVIAFVLIGFITGCASKNNIKTMEATGYCACGKCCGWERGSWKYLKLNFWHKYNNTGRNKGKTYSGLTASGTKPHEPIPGLFSTDTIKKPWMLPFRIVFPWLWLSKDGTLAADTKYYSFGTRMFVPGYGWSVVEDRGSAIKGPKRIDLFYNSHNAALKWGRQKVDVTIIK